MQSNAVALLTCKCVPLLDQHLWVHSQAAALLAMLLLHTLLYYAVPSVPADRNASVIQDAPANADACIGALPCCMRAAVHTDPYSVSSNMFSSSEMP